MALENAGSFQYLMYKIYWGKKNKPSPGNKIEALNFLIKCLAYFDTLGREGYRNRVTQPLR